MFAFDSMLNSIPNFDAKLAEATGGEICAIAALVPDLKQRHWTRAWCAVMSHD